MSPAPAPRFISTLRKELLQTLDRFDVSNQRVITIRPQCGKSVITYTTKRVKGSPCFPPNTLGYFYFHIPPKAPALAGEIRFRCADSVGRFYDGHDLLSNDNYAPWSIPPYKLGTRPCYASLRKQLVLDNLVSQSMLDTWAQIKATVPAKYHSGNRPMLYYLTQPFFLRFNDVHIVLYPTANEKISVCVTVSPFVEIRRDPEKFVSPYGGVGLVQLEPYVCPRRPERNMVALRVLKIIQPVQQLLENYAGPVLQPTEGMLVQRLKLHSNEPVVVTRNLDRGSTMKGLLGLPVNFDDL